MSNLEMQSDDRVSEVITGGFAVSIKLRRFPCDHSCWFGIKTDSWNPLIAADASIACSISSSPKVCGVTGERLMTPACTRRQHSNAVSRSNIKDPPIVIWRRMIAEYEIGRSW